MASVPSLAWLVAPFSGVNGGSPWAQTPAEGAVNLLECALGRYSSNQLLSGGYLLILMLIGRLEGLLRNLMFGLTVVLLTTGGLALLLLVQGALPIGSVGFGLVGGGVIGMMMLVKILLFLLVVVSARSKG